jgi:hypothetical protein
MKFPCTIDEKAERFCVAIAKEMSARFGISKEDAVKRINQRWSGLKIGGHEEVVYHEDEEYWAQNIYWGSDSYWWITGEKRKQMNLPPLKPLGTK